MQAVTDKELRQVNKQFRAKDNSHLYPINRRFNATDRAIRRLRKSRLANGPVTKIEYEYGLEYEISLIVNTTN